ncbi:MAG: hypothetical protein JSR34_07340 [Proteobacteria bacterium]|nr:hypothetical protein [Pseudomonadota bacterium]
MQIANSGLHLGEKLHVCLYHADEENRGLAAQPTIFKVRTHPVDGTAVEHLLAELRVAVCDVDESRLRRMLRDAVPEYVPTEGAQVAALPVDRRSHAR